MKCQCLKIFGIVQGVNFRRDTQKNAIKFGLCGTIRNLSDKTVEIEVTGEEEAINSLITWIESNPNSVKVDKIEYFSRSISKKFDEFRILY